MSSHDNNIAITGYTFKEARTLIGPLVGWPPGDIAHFVIITLDSQKRAGFGASPGIKPRQVPAILRAMADSIEQAAAP
jgi:hypothetical protein